MSISLKTKYEDKGISCYVSRIDDDLEIEISSHLFGEAHRMCCIVSLEELKSVIRMMEHESDDS